MATPIMRSSFHSDLLPIINKWHGDDLKTHEDFVSQILEVEKSDSAFEVHGMMVGMSTLQSLQENERLKYDS
ncbi:MAG TPA: hypothetical protein VGK47_07450, partial [Nitrososphaeraceae archaeon]